MIVTRWKFLAESFSKMIEKVTGIEKWAVDIPCY